MNPKLQAAIFFLAPVAVGLALWLLVKPGQPIHPGRDLLVLGALSIGFLIVCRPPGNYRLLTGLVTIAGYLLYIAISRRMGMFSYACDVLIAAMTVGGIVARRVPAARR